jgi:hypothetical protein
LTATIAGQTFTATVGAACGYTFSANAPDVNGNTWVVTSDSSERGVSVTVTPNDGSCAPWKAVSTADWIAISPTSATTSTTVRIDYTANSTTASRTGIVAFTPPGCTGSSCGVTVGVNQAPRPAVFTLHLTLADGEQLGGPFAGIVTGPNGFSCSNAHSNGQPVPCPAVTFAARSSVTLTVALTLAEPGDHPIFWSSGCDGETESTCTITMNADRNVTIAIGCAVCVDGGASRRQSFGAIAFSTRMIGAAFCSTNVFIRNFCPSAATTYSCRLPPVRVLEMRVRNNGTGEDGSRAFPSRATRIATAISFPSGAT